jgi:DNA (cytosine-5)-methyltransferase 1
MNTIIETFVGAGGAHLGFKNNNFKTIFVNDIWKESLQTLKLNNNELTDKQIICQDINELVKRDLCKEYDIKQGNLSVLIGGVVCKGFSLAGVRNPYDERNYLYLSQLKLVEQLRPKISIIENVPGMKNMKILSKKSLVNKDFTAPISKKIQIDFEESIDDLCKEIDVIITNHKNNRGQIIAVNKKLSGDIQNQELLEKKKKLEIEKHQLEKKRNVLEDTLDKYMYSVFDDIIERYKELGYNVYDKILMCSNYGGFTNRRRLIIVAVRNDLISNSQKEKIIWKWPKITNSDDIKDNLPKPMVHVEGVLTPPLPKLNTVKDAFDLLDYNNINNPKTDLDNVPMKHKQTTIEKFKLITNEKKSDGYSSRGSSNRLSFDKPAPTLVPGHSSFQIHPSEHRSISVREGAIITGFPPTYKFVGSHSDRCVQIGNAIPIHLSNVLAKSCIELLSQL